MTGRVSSLPLWEQIVRRMLSEGVNFDKPEQGMTILREVLGEASDGPLTCATLGHEEIPAAVVGTYDDGDTYELRVPYCEECARTMIASGEYVVTAPARTASDSSQGGSSP